MRMDTSLGYSDDRVSKGASVRGRESVLRFEPTYSTRHLAKLVDAGLCSLRPKFDSNECTWASPIEFH